MKLRKHKVLFLIIALIPTILLADPPTPPEGKVWVLVSGMSDEFDENSPDERKWNVFDQANSWPRTAAFDKRIHEPKKQEGTDNYYLSMNPIWYYPDERFNRNNRTYLFAGGGMDTKELATYGYFEVRLRPSNFPMGSGVFMNSRKDSSDDCNTKYGSELDIIENMSYDGPGANKNSFNFTMNVNSHAKPHKYIDGSCESLKYESTNSGIVKPKLSKTPEFITAGMWWKNDQDATFYYNNKSFGTIVPKRNFDLPMAMIIVTETYVWGDDENNAGNPKPVEYMFEDEFRTKDQRAVLYDWVRSWRLTDIDTKVFNKTNNSIKIHKANDPISKVSEINKNIIYSSTKKGVIKVELTNKSGTVIASNTYDSKIGVNSILANLTFSKPLSKGKKYTLTTSLIDGTNVVSRDKKTFKVSDKIIQNKLFGDLIPERFEPNSEFTVPIRYEAEGRMQIGGEIRGPNNEWLGGSVSPQVVSGEGIADVKIKVSKTLEEQGGYFFKFTMFPEGTSWKKSVANIKASPFVVSKPLRKSLKITSAAINKEGDKHIIDIDFDYSNDEDITLELTLLDNKGNLVAQKNREERKGKRSLKRNIFPKSLLPAGTYKVNLKSISVESKKVLESNKEIVLQ